MELTETFKRVKAASKTLGLLTDEKRNEILNKVADAIIEKIQDGSIEEKHQHTISPIIGVNFIRVNGKKLG